MTDRISEGVIDRVREAADIVEVVSGYIALKRAGRNYKGLCPFHSEKTPSFIVSSEKQIFHCFGCGQGGNVFNFVMKMENIDFAEAVKMLGGRFGISVELSSNSSKNSRDKESFFEANGLAAEIYHKCILEEKYGRILHYLKDRGLSLDIIKKFKIGYSPGRDFLLKELGKKNITKEVMCKAGLILSTASTRDYFNNRIIFPIFDLQDRVVGFGGRVVGNGSPKYLNTSDTVLFNKGRMLYGLNFSKESIRKEGRVVLVEGYMDLLALYQNGITNAVAPLGTALTADQISLLGRYGNRPVIYFCYDADTAGRGATLRGLELLNETEMESRIIVLASDDPDSFIKKEGAKAFMGIVNNALPVMEYHFRRIFDGRDLNSEEDKKKIAFELFDIIEKIKDDMIADIYLKRLSEELQIDEKLVRGEYRSKIKKYVSIRNPGEYKTRMPNLSREENRAEVLLLRLMLDDNSFIPDVREKLETEDFRDSACFSLVERLFEIFDKKGKVDPGMLISETEDEKVGKFISIFLMEDDIGDKRKMLDDCIKKIIGSKIDQRKKNIEQEIKKAESEGRLEDINSLLIEYQKLEKSVR